MADLMDVANGIVAAVAQAIYPDGTEEESAAGVPCKVYVGWPNPAQLDIDMGAETPVANISVYPHPSARNTTRYSEDWREADVPAATLTLAISGQAVTVGGTVEAPQIVALLVAGKGYPYAVDEDDTLTTIATSLTALVAADYPGTTSSGAVVTLPTGADLQEGRVGMSGTALRNLRQQERVFQITVWAAKPADREAISRVLDRALAKIRFLTMPDTTCARFMYQSDNMSDDLQKTKIYRRDFLYSVDYSTTDTEEVPPILLSGGVDALNIYLTPDPIE